MSPPSSPSSGEGATSSTPPREPQGPPPPSKLTNKSSPVSSVRPSYLLCSPCVQIRVFVPRFRENGTTDAITLFFFFSSLIPRSFIPARDALISGVFSHDIADSSGGCSTAGASDSLSSPTSNDTDGPSTSSQTCNSVFTCQQPTSLESQSTSDSHHRVLDVRSPHHHTSALSIPPSTLSTHSSLSAPAEPDTQTSLAQQQRLSPDGGTMSGVEPCVHACGRGGRRRSRRSEGME